jgi:hypothetical protein
MGRIHAWCVCGHHESWHFQGGACTRALEDAYGNVDNCECALLAVALVDVPTR